jgi:hypothetical protein
MNAYYQVALGCGHFAVAKLPVSTPHTTVAGSVTPSHNQVLCNDCHGYHQVLRSEAVVQRGYTRASAFRVTPSFMRIARQPLSEPPAAPLPLRGFQREVFKPKVMGPAGFFKT